MQSLEFEDIERYLHVGAHRHRVKEAPDLDLYFQFLGLSTALGFCSIVIS